jgi:hypothetical protein
MGAAGNGRHNIPATLVTIREEEKPAMRNRRCCPAVSFCSTSRSQSRAGHAAVRKLPGAVGWAAQTPGGRGGKVIRVTNLNADGPGSFREAIEAKGPRIVVFEVGGVIDMARKELEVREPFLTIAGQTAPSPGITLIRTGLDVRTHDVIVRHIRIRTGVDGQAKRSGWEPDAFNTVSAHRDRRPLHLQLGDR